MSAHKTHAVIIRLHGDIPEPSVSFHRIDPTGEEIDLDDSRWPFSRRDATSGASPSRGAPPESWQRRDASMARHEGTRLFVRGIIERELSRGHRSFILDLAECRIVDSLGLALILDWYALLAENGGRFALANPHPRVKHIFRVTRIDTVLAVYDSLPEAVEGVGAADPPER